MQRLTAAISPPLPATEKEFLYLLDVPATLRGRQIVLEVLTGRRKRDGSLGKLYQLRLTRADVPRLPEPADRQILALLAGAAASNPWASHWYAASTAMVPSYSEIPEPTAPALARLLCATGRCRLRRDPAMEGEPLTWDDGEPWELWLEVRDHDRQRKGSTFSLRDFHERALKESAVPLPTLVRLLQ